PYGPSFPDERRRLVPTRSPASSSTNPTSTTGIGVSGLTISTTGLRQRVGPKLAHRTTKKTEKLVLLPGGDTVDDVVLPAPLIMDSTIPTLIPPVEVTLPDLLHMQPADDLNHHHHHHHHNSHHPWYFEDPSSQTGGGVAQTQSYLPPPPVSQQRPVTTTGRTTAEMTSKDRRLDLPRVTCYCTADAYRLEEVTAYVASLAGGGGGVVASLYDECLYISHEGDSAVWGVLGSGASRGFQGFHAEYAGGSNPEAVPTSPVNNYPLYSPRSPGLEAVYGDSVFSFSPTRDVPQSHFNVDFARSGEDEGRKEKPKRSVSFNETDDVREIMGEEEEPIQPRWMHRKEMFLFDFGVADFFGGMVKLPIFWNFTEEEELRYIFKLRGCAKHPFKIVDFEIEDFHFQYDLRGPYQPRIYNDMITLKSGNPMNKLTISHAMAQSAKLALFENVMEREITTYSSLPKMMARKGEFKLRDGRRDVLKIVGRLFRLRMNVNLVSNVLDTPELFWSEPELQGLYNAIRGYLEISQRVTVLNTRVEVISDLLDMLQDHLNHTEVTWNTIIVIALIVITCIVASAEVYVKLLRIRVRLHLLFQIWFGSVIANGVVKAGMDD
ncbi:hypothetical protein HDU67_009886, partial [Dinochytrium kinnereticum]